LDIALNQAGGIGIHTVDINADGSGSARQDLFAKILAHPDDAIDIGAPERRLRLLDVDEQVRLEIRRLLEGCPESAGLRRRLLNNDPHRNVFGIERYPVAEDEQQDQRQDEGNGDARRVAHDLDEFLPNQPAQAHQANLPASPRRLGGVRSWWSGNAALGCIIGRHQSLLPRAKCGDGKIPRPSPEGMRRDLSRPRRRFPHEFLLNPPDNLVISSTTPIIYQGRIESMITIHHWSFQE